MNEDHQVEQEQHQGARSLEDRVIDTLGGNPSEWTVGDRRLAILALVVGLGIAIIAICGYAFVWEWTGFISKPNYRTFWDWLKLLVVPVVLALGGYLFTRSESRRTHNI